MHVPSSLSNMHTTKITVNFCLPAEEPHCIVSYTTCGTHMDGFDFEALTLTVCIAFFKAISSELQRGKISSFTCHSV